MNVAIFLQGFVIFLWILAVVVGGVAIARVSRGQPVGGLGRIVLICILSAILLTTVSSGLVFVNPQERGVVISAIAPKGYREEALQPGLRWVIPFAENVITYPISRQTYTMSASTSEGQVQGDDSIVTRTADGQQVNIDASVIYYIDPEKVVDVHIDWQNRYVDELVRPLVRGVIRDAVSQYGVQEVYSTRRDELSKQVTDALVLRMEQNGLKLQEFILRNITFSEEYAKSVEEKQVAEQEAQRAKFVVEQRRQEAEQARQVAQGKADAAVIAAKGDAQSRLIQAEAEAKALELIAGALQDNPDLLNYQYISKLSPNVQTIMLPVNTPFILPFPGQGQYGPIQTTQPQDDTPQAPESGATQPEPQPSPTPTLPVTNP